MTTLYRSSSEFFFVMTTLLLAQLSTATAQEAPADDLSKAAPAALEIPTTEVRNSVIRRFEDRPVVDRKIYSGKKTSVVAKEEQPTTPSNQYRQALAQIPGLMVSEVNNESYASIGYRGLGDPHESFNILMLRDGLPIAPDAYGYPAAYYIPPGEAIDRVEFFRGGAGLLYGPQPGGALNWQLRQAPRSKQSFGLMTKNLGGSFGQYSSYTEATGGSENFGVLGSLAFRGSRGFRDSNSDSKIINPRLGARWGSETTNRCSLDVDYYQGRFGEPGGFALTRAAGVIAMDEGIEKVTLPNDRFEFDRIGTVVTWDKDWSPATGVKTSLFHSQARRTSFRQTLGGSNAFGGIAVGTANTIQEQRFQTVGLDVRLLQKYTIAGEEQNLSVATTIIGTNSPYTQQTGASPWAQSGTPTRDLVRETRSTAIAIENAFKSGGLTVTPGVRAEAIDQKVGETLNAGSATPLRNATKNSTPILGGLGAEYKFDWGGSAYGNISQGYKPPAFADTVPLSTGDVVSSEIKEARTLSKEIGVRGQVSGVEADVSLFQVDYQDQFGRVANQIRNVGDSRTDGLEISIAGNITGRFSAYANATWLNATFVNGPVNGKTPQYAPREMYRAGVVWNYGEKSKVHIQVQSTGEHYGDDANTARFTLPSTTVWDLSGEQGLPESWGLEDARFNWGVQNVFDLRSYTRVRSTGVEPLQPLTAYAGLSVSM